MFDNDKLTKEILKNPTVLQNLVIQELTNRYHQDSNNYAFIGDPNNGFVFCIDAFASVTSQAMRIEDQSFEALYPKRATTFSELYNHISDFDYTQLNSSPCELNVQLVFDADWVIRNAIDVDETYKQIIIPDTTTVLLGDKEFGMYYPIIIKVNKNNNLISVTYDLSVPNPLKNYRTNLLLEDYVFTSDGMTYLSLAFPVYQFKTYSITIEPNISQNTGFDRLFTFDSGYFYAARIYAVNAKTNQQTELSYTLSQSVYDVNKPTVLIEIYNDKRQVEFKIPNIYFEKKLLDNNIKITIYVTEGKINEIINSAEVSDMLIRFDTKSSIYSAMLTNAVAFSIIPWKQTILDGGSEPLDFDALKDNVVNGTLNYTAPITNMQLKNHVEKYGFKLTKYIDNITDRIYYASSNLITTDKKVAPIVNTAVKFGYNDLDGSIRTILSFSDNLSVVMPDTVFRYDTQFNVSYPLKNNELDSLDKLSKADLVNTLNNTIYTRQPYHVILSFEAKYPKAQTVNLMNPELTSLMFIKEHTESSIQMSVMNIKIEHLDNGVGGYKFYFYVKRSTSIKADMLDNFSILFCYKNSSSQIMYKVAQYIGTDKDSGLEVFTTVLDTSYQLDIDETIHCMFNLDVDRIIDSKISLLDDYKLYACVLKKAYPELQNQAALIEGISSRLVDNIIVLSEQQAEIRLGESLDTQIYNTVNISWDSSSYNRYDTEVPQLYTSDLFQKQGNVLVTKTVKDDKGNDRLVPYTLFKKGDIQLTTSKFTIRVLKLAKSGTNKLFVDNIPHLLPGMKLGSAFIDPKAVITSIDTNEKSITLSMGILGDIYAGHMIYIANSRTNYIVSRDQTEPAKLILKGDKTLLGLHYKVVGFDICENAYEDPASIRDLHVISIDPVPGNLPDPDASEFMVTLDGSTLNTVKAQTILTAYNENAPYVYQHRKGDTVLDEMGNPLITTDRRNIYMVDMVQFDARLYASEVINDVNYVKNLPLELSQKSHSLDTIRDDLLERTYLYYKPYRTIGTARFIAGNQTTINLNLNLALSLIYYVPLAVYQSTQLKEVMTNTTIDLLTEYFENNTLISVTDIATKLKSHFSENVISIDINGIDDNTTLQTVVVNDDYVSPSVAYILRLREDNLIALEPNINIKYKTL